MDPLSISASVIALCQATRAIAKAVQFLGSLRKAPAQFYVLLNELSSLQAMLQQCISVAESLATPRGSATVSPDVLEWFEQANEGLGKVVSEMQTLVDRFMAASEGLDKNGHHRIPPVRWLFERSSIARLRFSARQYRENLASLLTALTASQRSVARNMFNS